MAVKKPQVSKTYFLDTNIILDNFENLISLSDNSSNTIIFSKTVLDELDSKKTIEGSVGYNAREFFRLMESSIIINKDVIGDVARRIELNCTKDNLNIKVELVTLNSFDSNENNTEIKNLSDRRIIETAKKISSFYANFIILSNDIGFRSSCILDDMDVESFKTDNKKVQELNLYRTFEVTDVKFPITLDKLQEIANTTEDDITNTCGIELVLPDGNRFYGYKEGNQFFEVNDEDLRKQIISPINARQKIFSSMILSDTNDIIVSSSKAGCSLPGSLVEIQGIEEFITKEEILSLLDIDKSVLNLMSSNNYINTKNKLYDKNSVNYTMLKLIKSNNGCTLHITDDLYPKFLKLEYWLGFNSVSFSVDKVTKLREYIDVFKNTDIANQKELMYIQSLLINSQYIEADDKLKVLKAKVN